jgi:hypothetical protein
MAHLLQAKLELDKAAAEVVNHEAADWDTYTEISYLALQVKRLITAREAGK